MQSTKKFFIFCIAVVIAISLSGPVMADNVEKINLNKASVAELVQLKKVGVKKMVRLKSRKISCKYPASVTRPLN
jgi:hypothetical protein